MLTNYFQIKINSLDTLLRLETDKTSKEYKKIKREIKRQEKAFAHSLLSFEKKELEEINHTSGKIEGFISYSTSTIENDFCQVMQTVKNSSCGDCYSESISKMYRDLEAKLKRNHFITEKRLKPFQIPRVKNKFLGIRFSAFGELENWQQLENYILIAQNNAHKISTLWTKRKDIVNEYFNRKDCLSVPDNMVFIWSVPRLNGDIKKKNKPKHFDKVFIVNDKETAEKKGAAMNCSKKCMECNNGKPFCYTKNDTWKINEIQTTKKKKG